MECRIKTIKDRNIEKRLLAFDIKENCPEKSLFSKVMFNSSLYIYTYMYVCKCVIIVFIDSEYRCNE